MLIVVLGAGASYDSTPRARSGTGLPTDPRPPLANGLFASHFQSHMDAFPACKPLVPRLSTSVEERLQRFREEAKDDPELYRQLMAVRHYIPRVIGYCEDCWLREYGRITNHIGLVQRVNLWCKRRGERACFVTFNYDTFVEEAFKDTLRIPMEKLEEYVANDTYKVIKLHGSVTWFREVQLPALLDVEKRNSDEIARAVIDRAQEVRTADGFISGDRRTVGKLGERGPVVVPAIAIPVMDKVGFECPDRHVEVLKECLSVATKLLVVGWQGKEESFLNLLRELLPTTVRGLVVEKDEATARKVGNDLIGRIGRPFDASRAEGFSRFIEDGEVDEYLYR